MTRTSSSTTTTGVAPEAAGYETGRECTGGAGPAAGLDAAGCVEKARAEGKACATLHTGDAGTTCLVGDLPLVK